VCGAAVVERKGRSSRNEKWVKWGEAEEMGAKEIGPGAAAAAANRHFLSE
jgi:hypothetical protein